MSAIGKLYGQMVRAAERAERLKAKRPVSGVRGVRRQQKIRRLEALSLHNREMLDSWDDDRWG